MGECSLAGHGVFESESAVLSKIPPILGGSGRLLVVSEWSLGGSVQSLYYGGRLGQGDGQTLGRAWRGVAPSVIVARRARRG